MSFNLVCMVLLLVLSVPAAAETSFHVAIKGDDANPGTREHPFASLMRAREAVRQTTGKRTVVVHGGAYEVLSTLTLGPKDSGSEPAPVIWRAAAGEVVRLVGGR